MGSGAFVQIGSVCGEEEERVEKEGEEVARHEGGGGEWEAGEEMDEQRSI